MTKKIIIHNHIAPKFSELELDMVIHIPQWWNWKDIPVPSKSKRVERIRETWWRTTLYWRLKENEPSFTISTYFNRMWNGTFIHPTQDRLISIREWARLQSFSDDFILKWTKTSQYKQIWNAVPVLLARAVAEEIKKHTNNLNTLDLFSWIWWFTQWFHMEWFKTLWSIEIDKHIYDTFIYNHWKKSSYINWDITSSEVKEQLINQLKNEKIWVIIWWPPCQWFSLAWLRLTDDPRNKLFLEYVHFVEKLEPEIFVMENVPWILSMNKWKDFEAIINEFKNIWYHINSVFKLNAEEYWVPQKRTRVFIIWTRENIKINEPKPLFWKDWLPKPITVKEAIWWLPIIWAPWWSEKMEHEYKNKSTYEKLMQWEIDFKEFYKLIKEWCR